MSEFFPRRPKVLPKIYAYEDTHPQYAGLLKVGYTTQSVQERIAQQYPTLRPGPVPYRIVLEEDAIRNDGTTFTDHEVHRMLRINGIRQEGGEWFRSTVEQVKAAINAVRIGQLLEEQRAFNFFATRIPIFLYLTDYRERTLRDVITQLEPGLFRRVTGLTVKDFELLVSLGLFNSALMNDAVYKFKRYEDPSLVYMGVNRHEGEDIGLYDTALRRKEYEKMFVNEPDFLEARQKTE